MVPIIGPIISLISTGISSYAETKQMKMKNETKLEEVKQVRLTKAQDDDAEWEKIMAEGTKGSWKDEYWTLILSIPVILCFIPGGDKYVTAGFEALEKTPVWFQGLFVTVVLASFGLKKLKQWRQS